MFNQKRHDGSPILALSPQVGWHSGAHLASQPCLLSQQGLSCVTPRPRAEDGNSSSEFTGIIGVYYSVSLIYFMQA